MVLWLSLKHTWSRQLFSILLVDALEHVDEEPKETCTMDLKLTPPQKQERFCPRGQVSMWSPPSEPHRTLLAPAFPRDRALLDVRGADLYKRGVGGNGATAGPLTLCPLRFAAIAGRTTCNGDSALGHGWPGCIDWAGSLQLAEPTSSSLVLALSSFTLDF